jgi:alkanesulfonate monooxygenase SsuD/methylene tetrahydromethanopterin reductase-like flavin-dependent oxidoreductase (luciferase family)
MSLAIDVGLVLPLMQRPDTGETPTWATIGSLAQRAEQAGFDTVWVADELLWTAASWSGPRGWWECVAMTGAVAATTTTIGIGTWVLSALHRNPGLTAKVAHTLDEVSGGRLLFGLGAGHAGKQGEAFGYPTEKTVSRYAEALEIIVPALRGGTVTFEGDYHQADDLEILPRGPRRGAIPLMLAGHGPRNMRLAARYGDIWSGFATESSHPDWFIPMLQRLDEACEAVGRDPGSIGRSIGVIVEPGDKSTAEEVGWSIPLGGPAAAIAEEIARFAELGLTRVELILWPGTEEDIDTIEEILTLLG